MAMKKIRVQEIEILGRKLKAEQKEWCDLVTSKLAPGVPVFIDEDQLAKLTKESEKAHADVQGQSKPAVEPKSDDHKVEDAAG